MIVRLSIVCDLEELSQIRSPIHSNVICKLQNPYLKLGNIGDAVNFSDFNKCKFSIKFCV